MVQSALLPLTDDDADLAGCLSRLDHEGAVALIETARGDGTGLVALVTGLVAPALAEVGRRWAAGEVGAAEALAAASIARSCLPRLTSPADRQASRGRTVAVCCPPGEQHAIPAEMMTEMLRQQGWSAQHIGTGVTAEQLPRFFASQRPVALMVSCTTPCALVGAARVIQVAHSAGVPVMVGGAAFDRDDLLALRLGAAGWAPTAAAAFALLDAWAVDPPLLPEAMVFPDEYVAFAAALPGIRAAAGESLVGLGGDQDSGGGAAQDRLELLLQYLAAALLVNDGRLFLGFLTWRREYYQARHIGPDRLDGALLAVNAALPAEFRQARRFMREGRRHLAWTGRAGFDISLEESLGAIEAVPAPRHPLAASKQAGQVFSDLLYVTANSCQVPVALISVPQPDGRWSTLGHGVDGAGAPRRDPAGEEKLFALIAAQVDPVEFPDIALHPGLAGTAMARCPGGIRSAFGVPLRSRQGVLLGVMCVLDRRTRTLSGRERQAVVALGRQVTGQLARWRREETPAATAHQVSDRRRRLDHPTDGPARRQPCEGGVELLRSREVAAMFDVTDRTVSNWAASKKLASVRTAGKHLRFRSDDVLALLTGHSMSA